MWKKRFLRFLRILGIILLVLLLIIGVDLLRSNYSIHTEEYSLQSEKIGDPVRIVFLADLHGKSFGKDNRRLLAAIEEQSPDLIALVGDVFNKDADEDEILRMCSFMQACVRIAPTYFGMGNQETSYINNINSNLPQRISETGVVIVDNNFLDLEIRGNSFRIGGYMGYYGHPHMMTHVKEQIVLERQFFVDFEDTSRFKLLLNHIPTSWLDWHFINKRPVDLALSGHYHGGVVRIPLLEKGLFAPYIGWFPPFTKGLFQGTQAACVLTTGLAGSYGIPRLFNLPEICVVDVLPAD